MATMTQTQTITLTAPSTSSQSSTQAASTPIAEHAITLRGSAAVVSEYFSYAIQSILYQRAVYDPTTFTRQQRWGVSVQVTIDDALKAYLTRVTKQVEAWLARGEVKKLVCVICAVDSDEVLERWAFDVETDEAARQHAKENDSENMPMNADSSHTGPVSHKPDALIAKEIGAVLRQITSCVSFLPLLDVVCAFDLLVYTPTDIHTPGQWEESDARLIDQSHSVKLRSFNTGLHNVGTTVTYKADDM